ncbi:hypothetical protein ABEB36_013229 [Hypothenemus hampei]|uniref:Protein ELYS n=1 Tax=Hypothenemus hampei TaxID=57062 RepID=A0ABD1E7A3_HYPHA
MSFEITDTLNFDPDYSDGYIQNEVSQANPEEACPIQGGILSNSKLFWLAKGSYLQVRHTVTGQRAGSWRFGGILRDFNTKITCVEELKRCKGQSPFLIVALYSPDNEGTICIFDIFTSKVLRAVQIGERITSLHVIESSLETLQKGCLKYFDGILAIGTIGGNLFLLDLCKEICENVIKNLDTSVRAEVNPCEMVILRQDKFSNIQKYIQKSMEREQHLAIHLNVIINPSTEHFILKGEKGEDRVHVERSEVEISSIFFAPQIASLLLGFNFGAFQMWDLRSLNLLYTSPICEGNIPITHFTIQEPQDDPKAYCYIWVTYSHNLLYHSGLPYAVMYSFYFDKQTYVNGYGNLYENFQHCSIRFQFELGDIEKTLQSPIKGGLCLGLDTINKCPSKDRGHSLALCQISWLIWDSGKEVSTSVLLFDLNQWYKEQMPGFPNWSHSSSYIIKDSIAALLLGVKLDKKSLTQFVGVQRLEEHFCPTSLTFDLWGITGESVIKIHNTGAQKAFLDKILQTRHLAMTNPINYSEQAQALGLVPLFYDIQSSSSFNIEYEREVLLNIALEQNLTGWLCETAFKLVSDSFTSLGLNVYTILNWAYQRAINIQSSLYKYCVPLFDYSGMSLDDNTLTLLKCGISQIKNLHNLYRYINKFTNLEEKSDILESQKSLENVLVYFEVLLWMTHMGILPELPLSTKLDNLNNVPYLVDALTEYYNKKRAELRLNCKETFVEKDCLLFIDNLIDKMDKSETLRKEWQEDSGSGLYPPPSIQAVLRTYFLSGSDTLFKHSLVSYFLMDLAMTMDEQNKVSNFLLKFPQIFNLSQSNIKIIQAFWHLDHNNYETALETILDPCVFIEDLQQWHHSVMMRSLLMQDQPSLALLYFKIRKPAIQDEKDLFTVISLLISKNLIDEAFKFGMRHKNSSEQSLLSHIFNECNKNNLLHTLLYRKMSGIEEKAFLNYLRTVGNPKYEDLQVFYHLIRARFLEAFETHSNLRRDPESRGLLGQRCASTADNVVKMFKSLLPDVNRNLVELVQKEKTNLWKNVPNPEPFSVFVHNTKNQVKYKSSVIFAALSKSKQTFHETLVKTSEDIPFLRTPSVIKNKPTRDSSFLKANVIELNEQGEEFCEIPCKKLKLTPRASKSTPKKPNESFIRANLDTPIVKRCHKQSTADHKCDAVPQSILKSTNMLHDETNTSVCLRDIPDGSLRSTTLGLTPRKSIRSPWKSHVKFENISTSSIDQSTKTSEQTTELSSKGNSDCSVSEQFHSLEAEKPASVKSLSKERLDFEETLSDDRLSSENHITENSSSNSSIQREIDKSTFDSPKPRRSYKRSFGDSFGPVRSSPRLARKLASSEKSSSIDKSLSISGSPINSKVKGRKSLARSTLEQNASKSSIANESIPNEYLVISKSVEVTKVETYKETIREVDTGNVTLNETKLESHSVLFTTEKDEDDSNKESAHSSEFTIPDVVETKDEKIKHDQEEINIYEDLSSGSEDVKQVVKQLTEEREKKEENNDIHVESSNIIENNEIIEIGSSSDEESIASKMNNEDSVFSESSSSNNTSISGLLFKYKIKTLLEKNITLETTEEKQLESHLDFAFITNEQIEDSSSSNELHIASDPELPIQEVEDDSVSLIEQVVVEKTLHNDEEEMDNLVVDIPEKEEEPIEDNKQEVEPTPIKEHEVDTSELFSETSDFMDEQVDLLKTPKSIEKNIEKEKCSPDALKLKTVKKIYQNRKRYTIKELDIKPSINLVSREEETENVLLRTAKDSETDTLQNISKIITEQDDSIPKSLKKTSKSTNSSRNDDSTPATEELGDDNTSTPLVLRTVKKTYTRKGSNASIAPDGISQINEKSESPELILRTIKKTYKRSTLTTETSEIKPTTDTSKPVLTQSQLEPEGNASEMQESKIVQKRTKSSRSLAILKESTEKPNTKPRRLFRSTSVDETPQGLTLRKRSLRSYSTDLDPIDTSDSPLSTSQRETRARSVPHTSGSSSLITQNPKSSIKSRLRKRSTSVASDASPSPNSSKKNKIAVAEDVPAKKTPPRLRSRSNSASSVTSSTSDTLAIVTRSRTRKTNVNTIDLPEIVEEKEETMPEMSVTKKRGRKLT